MTKPLTLETVRKMKDQWSIYPDVLVAKGITHREIGDTLEQALIVVEASKNLLINVKEYAAWERPVHAVIEMEKALEPFQRGEDAKTELPVDLKYEDIVNQKVAALASASLWRGYAERLLERMELINGHGMDKCVAPVESACPNHSLMSEVKKAMEDSK